VQTMSTSGFDSSAARLTNPDDLSDAELLAAVADVVRRPRRDPADSFVLHAPLELAARAALLPRVAPAAREQARLRLVALATQYEGSDDPIAEPPERDAVSAVDESTHLLDAIGAGDLDAVDASAAWLAHNTTAPELRELLADAIVASLAAAAHAPIFLFELPRVAPRGELPIELLRPLVRELARHPDWRLSWYERTPSSGGPSSADELFDAIGQTPQLGVPGSDFIFPVMSQAQTSDPVTDLAATALRQRDARTAGHAVLRAAALSMLTEDAEYAPYGWTHCLTLPQAVLGIAEACRDPVVPLAVATTFVVGFRAAFARLPLPRSYSPAPSGLALDEALAAGPGEAAATIWHAPREELDEMVTTLVTRAAVHQDAHLVKYTLACLDAAADDPPQRRLYLAAAASLGGYWATQSS
jgi:hypothetical protein